MAKWIAEFDLEDGDTMPEHMELEYKGAKIDFHCRPMGTNALPSAQPEPAQWVQMLINPHLYKCSNCQVAWNKRLVFDNEGHSENIFMKYCPCCGRKMKAKIDYE